MKKIYIFVSLLFFACNQDPTAPLDFVSEKVDIVREEITNLFLYPVTNTVTVYITNRTTHIISNSVDKSSYLLTEMKQEWYSNDYIVSKSSLYNTNLSSFRVEAYNAKYSGFGAILINQDKVKVYQGMVTIYDPTHVYTNYPYNWIRINIFWKEWTFCYSNY
jgi:hypothetical protein